MNLKYINNMNDKVVAEFTANGTRFQLIAHDGGREGWSVFTRVLNNWDLYDVGFYNLKANAVARFLFLTNRILLEVNV